MVRQGNPPVRDWHGTKRLKVQRAVYAAHNECWRCPVPIDWQADPRTKWAPSVDHVVPRSLGGDPYDLANCRLAHLGCNAARGNRLTRANASVTSRRW